MVKWKYGIFDNSVLGPELLPDFNFLFSRFRKCCEHNSVPFKTCHRHHSALSENILLGQPRCETNLFNAVVLKSLTAPKSIALVVFVVLTGQNPCNALANVRLHQVFSSNYATFQTYCSHHQLRTNVFSHLVNKRDIQFSKLAVWGQYKLMSFIIRHLRCWSKSTISMNYSLLIYKVGQY